MPASARAWRPWPRPACPAPAPHRGAQEVDEAILGSKGKGYRTVDVGGFEVLVGKGDAENDALTFEVAEPHDFWLHVAGPAGSHVVVRNPGRIEELPRGVLEAAAALAAFHSKARGSRGKVEVHACRVCDVSKPRGFEPGQVLLRRWTSVKVYPRESPR